MKPVEILNRFFYSSMVDRNRFIMIHIDHENGHMGQQLPQSAVWKFK